MDYFKQAIVNGDFVKAKHTALNMDAENLKEILFIVAYDEEKKDASAPPLINWHPIF